MEDQHKHNNSGGGGFLLGVMVGVAITLLFTTKKGREILKDTVNRAIDKFNELQSTVEEAGQMMDDEVEGDDYVKPEPTPVEPKKEVRYLATEKEAEPELQPEPQPKPEKEVVAPDELKEKTIAEEIEALPEQAEVEEVEEKKETQKKSPVRKFFRLKK